MKALIRLLHFLKRYWRWALFALVSMLFVSIFSTLQAYLIKPLFDDLLLGKSHTAVTGGAGIIAALDHIYQSYLHHVHGKGLQMRLAVALLIFVVMILKNIFMFLSRYAFAVVGVSTVQDLRIFLYKRLLRQPLTFFSTASTGELVSRVVSDVIYIQAAMAERLGDIVQESITLLGLLILIFSIDVKLSLFALVIAPLSLYPIIRFARSLRKASRKSQEEMANMAVILTETFQGNRIIKAFNAEDYATEKFVARAMSQKKANIKARIIQALNAPVVESIGIVLALSMFVYAGTLIDKGVMSVGEFSSFLAGLFMMYAPIKKLNKVNLALQQASVAAQRVFNLTDQEDEFAHDGTRIYPGFDETIIFDNASFAYTEEKGEVLHDISLSIRKGQVVAVVGASGAGKTTLCALLPRLYDPTEGRITSDGVDMRDFAKGSIRDKIAIVTQQTILFNDTVFHNIAYTLEGVSRERVESAARAAHAHEFIAALPLGYETVIGEGGITLSGGQRQRLSIARAILKNAPILILDEATSSLDSESERLVQEALGTLMAGRTTLIIAHRLSTIKHADHVIVLKEGKIVEEGTHDTLMAAGGVYAGLVHMQTFTEES